MVSISFIVSLSYCSSIAAIWGAAHPVHSTEKQRGTCTANGDRTKTLNNVFSTQSYCLLIPLKATKPTRFATCRQYITATSPANLTFTPSRTFRFHYSPTSFRLLTHLQPYSRQPISANVIQHGVSRRPNRANAHHQSHPQLRNPDRPSPSPGEYPPQSLQFHCTAHRSHPNLRISSHATPTRERAVVTLYAVESPTPLQAGS